jgi:hypothetical protein
VGRCEHSTETSVVFCVVDACGLGKVNKWDIVNTVLKRLLYFVVWMHLSENRLTLGLS